MIAIVDYGLGNVRAFANIYKRLNIAVEVVKSPDQLSKADRIILPGVGAFDWAMKRLARSGLRPALDEAVVAKRIPVLGICVGMQMMARRSDEGVAAGLGWFAAEVRRLDFSQTSQKTRARIPHMGWNDVAPVRESGLLRGLETGARFYFLHSYYFVPGAEELVLAVTDYNGRFASAVHSSNLYGVQFHPEKSHGWGIQLLRNFAELAPC